MDGAWADASLGADPWPPSTSSMIAPSKEPGQELSPNCYFLPAGAVQSLPQKHSSASLGLSVILISLSHCANDVSKV